MCGDWVCVCLSLSVWCFFGGVGVCVHVSEKTRLPEARRGGGGGARTHRFFFCTAKCLMRLTLAPAGPPWYSCVCVGGEWVANGRVGRGWW